MSYPLENISLIIENFVSIFIRRKCNADEPQSEKGTQTIKPPSSKTAQGETKRSALSQQIATRLSERNK